MTPMPATADPNDYIAMPATPNGGRVLVLHAWWGLNAFMRSFCDRLSGEGFSVLAPDLHHGALATTIAQAQQLVSRLEQDAAAQETTAGEVARAAERLQNIGGTRVDSIAVVGFSLGGFWSLWLSGRAPSPVGAAVVFYASRNADYARSRAAYQFHIAETDDYEPASEVEKTRASLASAGRPAEFHTYPGTMHWFFERDRPDAYNADAAAQAWQRTVAFLKTHIS